MKRGLRACASVLGLGLVGWALALCAQAAVAPAALAMAESAGPAALGLALLLAAPVPGALAALWLLARVTALGARGAAATVLIVFVLDAIAGLAMGVAPAAGLVVARAAVAAATAALAPYLVRRARAGVQRPSGFVVPSAK